MRVVSLILYLITLSNLCLFGQNVDWLRTFGTKNTSESFNSVLINKTSQTSTFVLTTQLNSISSLPDTIYLDTFQVTVAKVGNLFGSSAQSLIVKFDSVGNVLNVVRLGNFIVKRSCIDQFNNYYFACQFSDTSSKPISVVGATTTLSRAISYDFYFKLDSNYSLIWSKQTGSGNQNIIFSTIGTNDNDHLINIYEGHLYALIRAVGNVSIGDSFYQFSQFSELLCEIDMQNGHILWSRSLFKNSNLQAGFFDLLRVNNKIYTCGYNYSSTDYIIDNDTIFDGTSFILRLDTFGKIENKLVSNGSLGYKAGSISTDGTNLYIGGGFNGSFFYGNRFINPRLAKSSNKSEIFVASLSFDLRPGWFYNPTIIDTSGIDGGTVVNMVSDNNFTYVYGKVRTKTNFNTFVIAPSKHPFSNLVVFKIDAIGNVLWAADCGSDGEIGSFDAVSGAKVFIGGSFKNDTLKFGTIKVPNESINYVPDAFLAQLSDNAIIRGYVSNGPYCAGDTFKVPYRKIGDYDTSNYFIAELSDAEGNFNGGQRELGRIKSNQDSVILGKLPLFQVGSSEKYRIRILSTAPAVQSYYKVDTLRLLVYSRDKANPGPDTTICKGDTVLLQTYGGTKWTWSLKYKMKDSSARETKAWPDKTTTYKIIIADSSGCGEADTATKTVFVRAGLSVQFHTKTDTAVCLGGSLLVKASFHGGDSMAYNWQWTAIDSKGQYSFPRSGSGKQTDSLLFTMPPGETDSVRLVLSLTDGCTPGSAFSIYTLKIKKSKAQTVFLPGDTAACPGKPLPLIAEFKNGAAALLSWQWQEKNQFNQWLNRQSGSKKQGDTVSYTMPTNWKGLKQWRLILKDNCSGLNDTAIYNISPRDTLKLSLNTGDTILCKGQTYTYKATGKDGYPGGYVYVWTDVNTGDTLSMADSLTLQAESSRQIKVSLIDNCMPNTASRTINIQVHPGLQAEMNLKQDTVLCHGRNLNLTASASGGKGSGYTFQWVLEQTEIGIKDSLQFKSADYFTAPGTKTLYLILNDACSKPADTAQINITVLAPLKVTVNTIDSICYGNSALFKATATGGKGNYTYQWINENNALQGNTDSLKLTNASQTQTSIARKLIVSDGCSKNDTATIQTVFLAPLKITVNTTDSCPVNSTTLIATSSGGKAGQHVVTWYNNNNIQIGSGSSILVNPNGSAQTYRAILKDNCSEREDTAYLSIGSKPAVKLSATGVCLGDETSILAKKINTSNALNYQWEINNVPAPETDSLLKRKFVNTGIYKIKVSVSAGTACNGNDSTTVEIIHKPKAAFQYVHFQSNGMGIPFKFLNHSQNATHYHWYFGTGDTSQAKSPDYTYRDTGKATVILIASNRNKCFDTATQTLPIYDKIEFYFPNVFSPDGNNINEGFGLHAGQVQFVKEFHLQVYNRWGELVYKSSNPGEQWSSDRYQQGVYIWKAEIRDLYNVLHELEGVVELLK